MFRLVDERITWIDVRWPSRQEDGTRIENQIRMQVVLVDQFDLIDSLLKLDADVDASREALKQLVRDWQGVGDAKGVSVPMTDDNLTKLMRSPNFLRGFIESYAAGHGAIEDLRERSGASPEDGPVAEAANSNPAPSKSRRSRSA